MGIRYFAWSVPPDLLRRAATEPLSDFLRSEPWGHRCHPDSREPKTLDLDKSWRYLQAVFGPADSPSAAYQLVRGNVTNTCCGWTPFDGFVPADRMNEIANDLENIDECFVMDRLRDRVDRERFASDVEYTLEHLARAASFARELAASGSGLVYTIG